MHKHSRVATAVSVLEPSVLSRYVASSASRLDFAGAQALGAGRVQVGDALLVRVLEPNPHYHLLETETGENVRLEPGDVFVGVAGSRQALRGFSGVAPFRAKAGDRLALLNLGGVIGQSTGGLLDLGKPTTVEVQARIGRGGKPLNLLDGAIPPRSALEPGAPIVAVVGTSMSAGKTRAAVEVVAGATSAGLKVVAVKLTGVACLRDTLRMRERGAVDALSFLDAGLPSTVDATDLPSVARGLIHYLDRTAPDLIVAELGDGLLGPYGVDHLLQDRDLTGRFNAVLLSASDPVGAWGARELLTRWGVRVDLVTGPVTDIPEERAHLEKLLGVPAVNACTHGSDLYPSISARVLSMGFSNDSSNDFSNDFANNREAPNR